MSKPDAPGAPRIASALAGGGPLGAVYGIGALCGKAPGELAGVLDTLERRLHAA